MKIKKCKYITHILFFLGLIAVFAGFYKINELNYAEIKKEQERVIKHPENLPNPELAIATSFWFKNTRADFFWLSAIQYIWWNAIHSEYKKYLYVMLDLITELNPYFENPYLIGQLLLPSYSEKYENLTEEQQDVNTKQWESIWLKGIEKFCNMEKVNLIDKEFDLQKIWNDEAYKNPCKSYKIPFYLAYIYYFYKHEPLSAAKYYKVASANEDSLEGAKIMSAIMQGKGGDRQKSIFMFLTMAKTTEVDNLQCQSLANEIANISAWLYSGQLKVTSPLIKAIEETRNNAFWKFTEEREKDFIEDTKCSNFVNKAIRELNLMYIEEGNKNFEKDHNNLPSHHAKALFEEGYIDFLPTDFQQYKDYGIIYKYNYETKNYDYEMGTYD